MGQSWMVCEVGWSGTPLVCSHLMISSIHWTQQSPPSCLEGCYAPVPLILNCRLTISSAQQRTQMCALNNLFIWFSFPVLFVSVLVFCATAFWVLSDNRRRLIQSVRLYQPSFLYAYLALLMQGGVIQVCFWTVLPTIEQNRFWKYFAGPWMYSCSKIKRKTSQHILDFSPGPTNWWYFRGRYVDDTIW